MKNKVISIAIIISLIISSIYINNIYDTELDRVYHQHLNENSSESDCKGLKDCSHLPIVNININKQTIPIKKSGLPKKGEDYIIGTLNISDNIKNVNILNKGKKSIKARIRYRGRTSLNFDKKGYSIKFINDKNEKIDKKFLGMPSDSEWVLHGPFIDKTLIRNYMWYNISSEIMTFAPKCRFLELYIDSKYQGVYLAVEKPTQNTESRVRISEFNKKTFATSYILKLDDDIGSSATSLNSFVKYTHKLNAPIKMTITYPNEKDLNELRKKYIYEDFTKFEKMLYSFDYRRYPNYIDVGNFIDYFIINEFTQNYDAGFLSTYIYKDVSGKFKMFVWDFNSANNNYSLDFLKPGTQDFKLIYAPYFNMLIKDPAFTEAVIKRYRQLRKTYLSNEYLNKYIDDTILYLGPAVDRNFKKWGYTFKKPNLYYTTNYQPKDYDDAIRQLKNSIKMRGNWMDENIEVLKKYSHESINKKFNK